MALSAKNEMFMKDKRKQNGCTSVTNRFHRQLVGTMHVDGGDVVHSPQIDVSKTLILDDAGKENKIINCLVYLQSGCS